MRIPSSLILPYPTVDLNASARNRTTADYYLSLLQPKRYRPSCWTKKDTHTPTQYVLSSSRSGTHGERVSLIHHVDATGCLVSISMSSIMATRTRISHLLLTGPFTDAPWSSRSTGLSIASYGAARPSTFAPCSKRTATCTILGNYGCAALSTGYESLP